MNLDNAKEALLLAARRNLEGMLGVAESPIEQAMILSLLGRGGGLPRVSYSAVVARSIPEQNRWVAHIAMANGDRLDVVTLVPQVSIVTPGGNYRLDVGIHWPGRKKDTGIFVAVECDGHDYHERTKEQAEHDKARDRDLQAAGWLVARFTGSQINRDPDAVADEVWNFCRNAAGIPGVGVKSLRQRAPLAPVVALSSRAVVPEPEPVVTEPPPEEVKRRTAELMAALRARFAGVKKP